MTDDQPVSAAPVECDDRWDCGEFWASCDLPRGHDGAHLDKVLGDDGRTAAISWNQRPKWLSQSASSTRPMPSPYQERP